jgi:hypothetical protein
MEKNSVDPIQLLLLPEATAAARNSKHQLRRDWFLPTF